MVRWPPPQYHITVDFDVPLSFAYRWCTDFQPDDSALAGEHFDRRILRRSRNEVLFEDLWWERDGWFWRRNRVALHPPDSWHVDSVGNFRDSTLDYHLTELPGGQTRFDLRLRRRPVPGRGRQLVRATLEAELRWRWRRYAREMVRDYHRSAKGRRSHPRARSKR